MSNPKRKQFTIITCDEDDIHIVIKQKSRLSTTSHSAKKPKLQASNPLSETDENDEEIHVEDCDQHVNIKNLNLGDILSTADFFQEHSAPRTEEESKELLFTRKAIVDKLSNIEKILETGWDCQSDTDYSLSDQFSESESEWIPSDSDNTIIVEKVIAQPLESEPTPVKQKYPNRENIGFWFPLDSLENLAELDVRLEQDENYCERMADFLSAFRPDNRACTSGLAAFCSKDFLKKVNWDGSHNAYALRDSFLFSSILFRAWSSFFLDKKAYIKNVANQVTIFRKRVRQRLRRSQVPSVPIATKKPSVVTDPKTISVKDNSKETAVAESSADRKDIGSWFPLDKLEILAELDTRLAQDDNYRERAVVFLSTLQPGERACDSGLIAFCSGEFLEKVNWDGSHGAFALRDSLLFSSVLFQAWQSVFPDRKKYQKELANQITLYRKRVAQRRARNPNAISVGDSRVLMKKKLASVKRKPFDNKNISYWFPLYSLEVLAELDTKMAEDDDYRERVVDYLSTYKPDGRECDTGLTAFCTDIFLSQVNWDGTHGAYALRNYLMFSSVLFQAWKSVFSDKKEYIKDIAKQITLYRKRTAQRRRRNRLKNADADLVSD